jgi:hypothetical protein
MGGPLGTIGDVLEGKGLPETPASVTSEILNLRWMLGILDKTIPQKFQDLLKVRGSLRLLWQEKQKTEKERKAKKAFDGYTQRIENSGIIFDHINSPKKTAGEACETFGCQNIVYGNARFCDDCRKKKEYKRKTDNMPKHYYDESVWKEAVPNIIHVRNNLKCSVEEACNLYGKVVAKEFSVSGFYKYKKPFGNLTTPAPADLVEKCRVYYGQKPVASPLPDPSQPEHKNGQLSQFEEKVLADLRKVMAQTTIDKVLDWLASLSNSNESISMLQQVQDILNEKLSEAISVRKKEQEAEVRAT